MKVREVTVAAEWDSLVRQQAGHPLQLWGWGELKAAHNWRAYRLVVEDDGRVVGGAQVLQRVTPWPFRSLLYVPRGPVGVPDEVLPPLTKYLAAHTKATHLSIEPNQVAAIGVAGWRRVAKAALLPRTIILDLAQTEDELLAAMTKKTRQYIRKSAGSGVVVRMAGRDDIASCLAIYRQTAIRANFSLHSDQYYYDIDREMGEASQIFVAEHKGEIVAFVWLAVTPEVAFELYGGMNETGQQLRANYTLKWQTIRAMRQTAVRYYDMNGLLNDGVSNFKKGFASQETELAGTFDYRLSAWYWLWSKVFPVLKQLIQQLSSLRR